jgi:hypothetical protein
LLTLRAGNRVQSVNRVRRRFDRVARTQKREAPRTAGRTHLHLNPPRITRERARSEIKLDVEPTLDKLKQINAERRADLVPTRRRVIKPEPEIRLPGDQHAVFLHLPLVNETSARRVRPRRPHRQSHPRDSAQRHHDRCQPRMRAALHHETLLGPPQSV